MNFTVTFNTWQGKVSITVNAGDKEKAIEKAIDLCHEFRVTKGDVKTVTSN